MKNLNKKTEFDRQWEDVFREAEISPPEGIWDKIDSALSKEEAGYFKKRAFLFKMLAAASIAFALGIGLFSLNYYLNQNPESTVTEKIGALDDLMNSRSQGIITEKGTENDSFDTSIENQLSGSQSTENQSPAGSKPNSLFTDSENKETNIALLISEPKTSGVDAQSNSEVIAEGTNGEHIFLSLNNIASLGVYSNITEQDVFQIDHIYRIPIMPRGASKNKKERETGVYLAGLDISTGVFDPNFQQGESIFASSGYSAMADARVESFNDKLASFNTSSKDFLLVRSTGKENEPQIALSYGANVGFKLTDRIVLQTGLAYRKANTTISTTGYIEEAGSDSKIPIVASHQYQFSNLSSVSRIPETGLKNQYEFAAIPLQAGYIVLDKKINLTLLAGISSEFFLNNRITDESKFLETLNNSSDDASPYKSVYFNGSLGTMLGYSFAENYQIMLEPSYRFAVNSFTKDDFYLESYPSSLMITFGVAYNFR